MEDIIILGMGGHAASVADTIERAGQYRIAGYVVNEEGVPPEGMDYPVLGGDRELLKLYRDGIRNAALGIGYLGKKGPRIQLWQKLKDTGYLLPVIRDPSALVSKHAQVREGCFVGKGAVINAGARIGEMCIINTRAVIEHDCVVGAFSHISVGSILCGGARVGELCLVGANATVLQGRTIGCRCIVGAGATVRKNMREDEMTYQEQSVYVKNPPGGGQNGTLRTGGRAA